MAKPETSLLDERLLVSPGLALGQCTTLLKRMAMFARQNLLDAMGLFRSYDQKAFEHVAEVEDNIDRIEDRLGNYLQKLTDRELTDSESRQVTYVLHLISKLNALATTPSTLPIVRICSIIAVQNSLPKVRRKWRLCSPPLKRLLP